MTYPGPNTYPGALPGGVGLDYPATVSAVAAWLGVPAGSAGDVERAHIATVVPAVNTLVRRWHPETPVDDAVKQGCVMLAARITRRRNSPAGVEAFGDLGATYVARYDPDIDQLLQLGEYRRLVVG